MGTERDYFRECMSGLSGLSLQPASTRSWDVSDGENGRRFTVTWSAPGVLMLCGSPGDLVLTNNRKMSSWRDAVRWLKKSYDVDSHLGCAPIEKGVDPEATAALIIAEISRKALPSMEAHRKELQLYRRVRAELEDSSYLDRPRLTCSFLRTYMNGAPEEENKRWFKGNGSTVSAPDGWDGWLTVLLECGEDWHKPNDIFTSECRRELKERLEEKISDDPDDAEHLSWLITGNYLVKEAWPRHRIMQMAALYHWAELVADTDEFSRSE